MSFDKQLLVRPRGIVLLSSERGTILLDVSLREHECSRDDATRENRVGNVVGYVRISKEEAGSRSLETQEHAIRRWCETHGHRVAAVYRDEGISGAVAPTQRAGAAQAIRDARKRKNGILVVSKLDRISRDLRDVLALVDDVLGHRATLISISESFDASTPSGRMFLQLLGTFGEFERNKIRERTREALATRRREWKKTGGAECPFGYRAHQGKLVRVNKEQATLAAARRLRGEGLSWQKVSEQLNVRGNLRRNGKLWTRVKLFEVIQADDRRRGSK